MIKIFSIVFFLSVSILPQEFLLQNYSVPDGLSQTQVLCIAQNFDGVLWIGTNGGGISKYDGNKFTTLSVNQGLSDNMVYAICHSEENTTWIGTSSGLSLYKNLRVTNYSTQYGSSRINKIISDKNGGIWIADNTRGLAHLKDNKLVRWNVQSGLPSNSIKDLHLAADGTLWIATLEGLSKFNGESFLNFNRKNGLLEDYVGYAFLDAEGNIFCSHSKGFSIGKKKGGSYEFEIIKTNYFIHSFAEDQFNNLFVATQEGLFKYKNKSLKPIKISNGSMKVSLGSIYEDFEGNIWLGSDGFGLYKIRRTNFTNYTANSSLIDDNVWSITQDNNRSIWISTNINGVFKIEENKIIQYKNRNGLTEKQIFCSYLSKRGELLFGTVNGVFEFDGTVFKPFFSSSKYQQNIVLNITEDKNGDLWFGTISGAIKFNKKEQTHYELGVKDEEMAVFSIFNDKDNQLWFLTEDEGVFIRKNENFVPFIPHEIFNDGQVWCVAQDQKDNLWFGHWGKGLIFWNSTDSSLQFIDEEDGLIENTIVSMKYDGKRFLWIGTNKGVSRLDLKEYYQSGRLLFKNFQTSDGFAGHECNQGALYIDDKGNVWIGHNLGVSEFREGQNDDIYNVIEPKLKLLGINLFYQKADFSNYSKGIDSITGLPVNLSLPYNKNFLQFSFVGVSLTVSEKVSYSYMLEGLDTSWSPPSQYTFANYTNLSPGEYKFMVKASNNDGLWNLEPLTFSFIITPPFWKTWWFVIIVIISSFSTIFLVFQLRIRSIQKRNELIRKSEERLNLVIRGSNDAPWDYDLEKNEIYYSPQWWRMLGYSPEEIKPNNNLQTDFIHPDDLNRYNNELQTALNSNKSGYELEFRLKHKDGHYVPILMRGFIQRNEIDNPVRISGTNMDLTIRKKAEMQLIQAKEKAEEMNRIKSYFFANMSHELRTPFVGIMGYAEILSRNLSDPNKRRMAEVILNSSKRMKDTLTKILDLTRVELGKTVLEIKPIGVEKLISEVIIQYIKVAEKNKIIIKAEVNPSNIIIESDENLLRSIFNNLIQNSVKFTEKGEIVIMATESSQEDHKYLIIKISDTGIGIPEEKLDIIWDEFRQASEGLNRTFEGTGLGLTLVKKYVEYLEGSITVESELGKGTTFNLKLPMIVQKKELTKFEKNRLEKN